MKDLPERKGLITFHGNGLTLVGTPVEEGMQAPTFQVLDPDLNPVTLEQYSGRTLILATVPSLDTGVCSMEAKRFNDEASGLSDVDVVIVSMDLPFAQARWKQENAIENIVTLSDHKDATMAGYGLLIKELRLLARCVMVVDRKGTVTYTQLVPEVTSEPDYDAALKAARTALDS
jgi:thiol peroxidase